MVHVHPGNEKCTLLFIRQVDLYVLNTTTRTKTYTHTHIYPPTHSRALMQRLQNTGVDTGYDKIRYDSFNEA